MGRRRQKPEEQGLVASQVLFTELVRLFHICDELSYRLCVLRTHLRKLNSLPGLSGPDNYSESVNLRRGGGKPE
jgi:hypothetical protein